MPPRFTCPTCKSINFEQVCVRLPRGSLRQTDFFCCTSYRTVFFDPSKFAAGHPAGNEQWVPTIFRRD